MLVLLISGAITTAAAPTNKIRKDEALQQDVGDGKYLTWGDYNSMAWKLNTVMGTFIVFVVWEIISGFRKSHDGTKTDIKAIRDAIIRIEGELKLRPTWKDIHNGKDARGKQ